MIRSLTERTLFWKTSSPSFTLTFILSFGLNSPASYFVARESSECS